MYMYEWNGNQIYGWKGAQESSNLYKQQTN